MKVLLVVAYLTVACLEARSDQEKPKCKLCGAGKRTFLFKIQNMINEEFFPADGQNFTTLYANEIERVKNEICMINQGDNDSTYTEILLGQTCRNEFIKQLYTEHSDKCSSELCTVVSNAERFLHGIATKLISAETEDKFFDIIKKDIINPFMMYSCRGCLMKIIGAWMKCKSTIKNGHIWEMLKDLKAEDEAWKEKWVNVTVNRIPWESIEILFDRTMANLCQRNTDLDKTLKLKPKCYSYFFDAFTKLYEVYLKITGKKTAGLSTDAPLMSCTTYEEYSEDDLENLTFSNITDLVVAKFCVRRCKNLYKNRFLGCCSASMINDTALETAIIRTIEGLPEILFEEFFEDGSLDIPLYLGYYRDVLQILRNPTCKNGVKYNLTPCGPKKGKKGKKEKKGDRGQGGGHHQDDEEDADQQS